MKQRRCPNIQLCPTCGVMRIHHPHNAIYDCPVPKEVTAALLAFKVANGLRWKSKLRSLWNSGNDEGLLRQARNMIGPSRLDKIKL